MSTESTNRIPDGTRVRWFDEDFGPVTGRVACYYELIGKYAVDWNPMGRTLLDANVLHSGNPTKVVRTNPAIERL